MYGFSYYDNDMCGEPVKKNIGSNLIIKLNKNASITCNIKFGKSTSVNKMSQLRKKINEHLQLGMHNYNEMKIFNNEGKILVINAFRNGTI